MYRQNRQKPLDLLKKKDSKEEETKALPCDFVVVVALLCCRVGICRHPDLTFRLSVSASETAGYTTIEAFSHFCTSSFILHQATVGNQSANHTIDLRLPNAIIFILLISPPIFHPL